MKHLHWIPWCLLSVCLSFFIVALAASEEVKSMSTEARDNVGLVPRAFEPLPLGSIKPTGWLQRQLRIQADGSSGRLDEFWASVGDSAWFGGRGDAWERGPYWLDGLVPLAFVLDDEMLKLKVKRCVDYILTHQQDDGWLGPVDYAKRQDQTFSYDPWPAFVALKALTQYHEATGDERVIPAMLKFFRRLDALVAEKPLFSWGMFRWMDCVLCIHWVYERVPEPWLLELGRTIQKQGFDWQGHFADFQYKEKTPKEQAKMETHVVNNAMAVKQAGVWFRQTNDPADREAVDHCLNTLDEYHGTVVGAFTGDEHFAGKHPSQGTELCAVVEYMFSLENLISFFGDVVYSDRLEKIAYNALPAQFTPDMWGHQYDQQVNQVLCKRSDDHIWETNGPEANLFGLEPNYGCCTANFHQGFPKFVSHLWMKSPDGGLAAVAYGPCRVETSIGKVPVRVEVQTEYPFKEKVTLIVHAAKATEFPLHLRVPTWAEGATVRVGKGRPAVMKAGSYHCIKRKWTRDTRITLELPMPVSVERRYNNSASIVRGPLVYSLTVDAEYKPILSGNFPYTFWELYPKTDWNYALKLNVGKPDKSLRFEQRSIGDYPFSPEGAPIRVTVKGRILDGWVLEHNAAGTPPQSPVSSDAPLKQLELIPYGCTMLRVTEFPVLD